MKTKNLTLAFLFVFSILLANNLFAEAKKKSILESFYLNEELDPELEIEEWMLEDMNISVKCQNQEDELKIEAWMIQPFEVNSFKIDENEQEDELIIEAWMVKF